MSNEFCMSEEAILDFDFEEEFIAQDQQEECHFANIKYCPFCGACPSKMKNHDKAHELRYNEEFI